VGGEGSHAAGELSQTGDGVSPVSKKYPMSW
jgi:hypothetical protein